LLFDQIRSTMPPLRGIIHAAGVLDDAIVLRQDREKLQKAFGPKVQGAWYLHQLTASMPLDFCIYFSSTASLFGSRGQGNYAAANAFLDALAHYRRSLGLVGLSINWGPWAEAGMAAEVEKHRHVDWAKLGIDPMAPERGLEILGRLMRDNSAQVGVVRINWPRFRQEFFRGSPPPFFQALQCTSDQSSPSDAPDAETRAQSQLVEQLKTGRPAERRSLLTTYVCAQIAHVLRSSPEAIQPLQGLFDAGLDSLMAIELKERLALGLGSALPQTLLFDYPTIEAMVDFLLEKLECEDTPNSEQDLGLSAEAAHRDRDVTSVVQEELGLNALLAQAGQMTESDIARQFAGRNIRPEAGEEHV